MLGVYLSMLESSNPKVSIIVPLYNDEKYVEECLKSLSEQTLFGFEILMVNDCGGDKTLDLAKKFVESFKCSNKFTSTLIENEKNIGLAASRNKGILEAKGKYVVFLDADDYLSCDALEKIYSRMESQNLEELYFNAKSFYESLTAHRSARENFDKRTSFDGVYNGVDLFAKMIDLDEFFPQGALRAYKRTFLLDNQLFFEPSKIHEDLIFWVQSLTKIKRTSFLNEQIYFRRVHVGSISNSRKRTIKNVDGHFQAMFNLDKWTEDNKESLSEEFLQAVDKFCKKYGELCARDICYFIDDECLTNYLSTLNGEEKSAFDRLILKPHIDKYKKNPNNSKFEAFKRYLVLPIRGAREVFLYLKEKK